MLSRLTILDVVLIDKLTLSLERGLNVFTGETGAGKSILLDALGLALGGRSDAGLVRGGAAQAIVTAEFLLDDAHALFALAEEHGLSAENPILLRRAVAKDGKSRAFFNDQPIGIGLLKQFGETLLEIHGQFETHGLLNADTHRGLLDSFGSLDKIRLKTAAAYKAWQAAATLLQETQTHSRQAQAEEQFLRAAIYELEELAPLPRESEQLAEKRGILQHREKIFDAMQAAAQSIDSDRGASAALTQAGKAIARVADKAEALPAILAAIDRAAAESAEASQMLARFTAQMDADPQALQRVEERLFALRAAARKHSVQVEALPDLLIDLRQRIDLLGDGETHLKKLAAAAAQARQGYTTIAEELSARRKVAAGRFEKAISKELPPLKLERARVSIDLAALPEAQWGAEGRERVSFLISTNPGTAPGPLQKIASGGELARFMLALKTVLAAADPVPVLVFDEVDTGIGGAVASAIGERLAHLAEGVQILVVTHSPQVAARGNHHLRVAKRVNGKHTVTDVDILDAHARREEIARMLSGSQITDAARQAAESLISNGLKK